MPRGGSRKGAGRPRKTAKARSHAEKCLQDTHGIDLGWNDGQVISEVATGEYAVYKLNKLYDRLKAELPEYDSPKELKLLDIPGNTAATIALGNLLANDIAIAIGNKQSIATTQSRFSPE